MCLTLRVLLLVLLMLRLGLGLVLLHVGIVVVWHLLVCVMAPLRPTISSHDLRRTIPYLGLIPSLAAAPVLARILMTLIKMMADMIVVMICV